MRRSSHDTYDFIVENTGESDLWNLRFSTYDFLGPGAFGLDDTHMPPSLTEAKFVEIFHLPPYEYAHITTEKWQNIDRYQGPESGPVSATFSFEEGGTVKYSARIVFRVFGDIPIVLRKDRDHSNRGPYHQPGLIFSCSWRQVLIVLWIALVALIVYFLFLAR